MQHQISSRIENIKNRVLRKVFSNFAEDNTSRRLNRESIEDLSLLRTLLAIHQKSWEPSFWEVMEKRKKWFLWTMAAAQAAENHRDEWDLTWYFRWGIYPSIPTWTNSRKWLAAAEAQTLKISSHGTSLKWSRGPSQSA